MDTLIRAALDKKLSQWPETANEVSARWGRRVPLGMANARHRQVA
jgi:hypothetical protein